MTRESARVNLDRVRQPQRFTLESVALPHHLHLIAMVTKTLDHVCFPVSGSIATISWVQRSFLLGVGAVRLPQVGKDLGGPKERNGLGNKRSRVCLGGSGEAGPVTRWFRSARRLPHLP